MSENLTPDRVLEMLNRYYGHVSSVVDRYEGYIDKFIGDAVYVVFNGPIDQHDHVDRGVRCAIAIQQKIAELNAASAFPEIGQLDVGVGVATGPVVAGNLGRERTQYSIIGDTVNLASRLSQLAPRGEIWINSAAARALPEQIAQEPLEPITVKGKARQVEVHRVTVA
jgi:adenylate cyclase